jgi:hypothetical protein
MKQKMAHLNDGTSVPLEVFNKWTPKRQEFKTRPLEEIRAIGNKIRIKNNRTIHTPIGTFASMEEAILQTQIPYARLRKYLLSTEHPEYSYAVLEPKDVEQQIKARTPDELDAMRIRRGMAHRRAVNTPKGQFETVREAIKVLGITKDALRDLCLNTAYPLYSYVNPTKKDLAQQYHKVYKGGPKKTVTPIGTYATKGLAAKALGVTYDEIGYLIKTQPKKYYYSEDNVNIGIRKAHDPALYHPTKGYRLPKEYMTPTGPYPSKLQACTDYGLSATEFDYLMEKHPKDFYKMKK